MAHSCSAGLTEASQNMTSFLRPAPEDDPRPRRLDIATCLLSVTRHTEIEKWAQRRGLSDDPDYARRVLANAIEQASGDPEKTVSAMQVLHQWEPDFPLLGHAISAIKHLPECWDYLILQWVVRTGMRFPGKTGDLVLFWDGEHQRKGRVGEIVTTRASSMVQGESGHIGPVMAENVIANITTGEAGNGMKVIGRVIPVLPMISSGTASGGDRPCDSGF